MSLKVDFQARFRLVDFQAHRLSGSCAWCTWRTTSHSTGTHSRCVGERKGVCERDKTDRERVCERKRVKEGERERAREGGGERERERERVCVCVRCQEGAHLQHDIALDRHARRRQERAPARHQSLLARFALAFRGFGWGLGLRVAGCGLRI